MEELGLTALELLGEYKGAELEGLVCEHPPLFDRDSLVILGGHVTLEAGTGCVHTAPPGHGHEDYIVGLEYGLPILSPVDGLGRFTEEAGPYSGLTLDEGNKKVTEDLEEGRISAQIRFRRALLPPTAGGAKNPLSIVPRNSGLFPLIISGQKCSKKSNG